MAVKLAVELHRQRCGPNGTGASYSHDEVDSLHCREQLGSVRLSLKVDRSSVDTIGKREDRKIGGGAVDQDEADLSLLVQIGQQRDECFADQTGGRVDSDGIDHIVCCLP